MRGLATWRVALVGAVLLALSSSAVAWALSAGSGVSPTKSLTVHDANGRLVGQVVDVTVGPVVVLDVEGTPVSLSVHRDGFGNIGNTSADALLFASTDCSGEALTLSPPDAGSLLPPVLLNQNRIYAPTGSEQIVQIQSLLLSDGTCRQEDFGTTSVFAAEQLADLGAVFTPPFTLRVK